MMHTLFGGPPALPASYSHHNMMLDDLSRQMAMSQASRRLSRGSTGQRSGTAMRVVKPTSANNSPRSSGAMARRKTLMNDGSAQRRRQQALEQTSMLFGAEQSHLQQQPRSSRPVSWHPNTYAQQLQPQLQHTSYPVSTANMYADQQDVYPCYPHLSPMMASHSCNTSPSSAFSPLSLPIQNVDNIPYLPTDHDVLAQQVPTAYSMPASQSVQETFPTDDAAVESMAYTNGWDWNTFIMHGFSSTSPPTPEAFPQAELSQPAMSEESIPYQSLEESAEDDGEILVGMGLYDAPEKYEEDPQLNNYRSTVSSLLGSTFRPQEPKGKGLKLEETWEPPKSDDEDEDEDEDEESDNEDE